MDIWKKLWRLGLSKPKKASHGFNSDELNTRDGLIRVLHKTVDDGFKFRPATFADVVLAISYFSSQGGGENEIPFSAVVESIPLIAIFLMNIFISFLVQGFCSTA